MINAQWPLDLENQQNKSKLENRVINIASMDFDEERHIYIQKWYFRQGRSGKW